MMMAALEGNVPRMRQLMHNGVAAWCRAGFQLHGMIKYAAVRGHINAIRFLIEEGADLDARGTDGSTALYSACIAFEPEAVDFLISKKASMVGEYDGTTLLRGTMSMFLPCWPMDESKLKVVSSLLSAGQVVYGPSVYYKSALQEAVCAPYFSIPRPFQIRLLDLFLEYGADVNEQDTRERTALHHAAMLNNFEATVWLLKAGVDIFTVDNSNLTAAEVFKESGKICERNADYAKKDFRVILLLREVAERVDDRWWRMHQFSMGLHKRSTKSPVQILSMEHIHSIFNVKVPETEQEKEMEKMVALQMKHRALVGM